MAGSFFHRKLSRQTSLFSFNAVTEKNHRAQELTSLSCRSIAPRRPPSWVVELAARKSTWSWAVRLSRCRRHSKRANSYRPRISSGRRPTRWILSSRRWSRTWCYTLLALLRIPVERPNVIPTISFQLPRCVTILRLFMAHECGRDSCFYAT